MTSRVHGRVKGIAAQPRRHQAAFHPCIRAAPRGSITLCAWAAQAGDWEAACSKLAQEVKDARGGTQAVAYYVAARLMAAGARISSTNAAKLARFAGQRDSTE